MKQNVLVVGHADADGHLIAEQARRNLSLIDNFEVSVVVDPNRTQDHKAWTHLESIGEVEKADIVFFVDLMFAPATFVQEAKALVAFVNDRPDKKFFLIDHHPLPLRRLEQAQNLRMIYRPDVFELTFGPRSGMMVVAALCEKQGSSVADIKQPVHDALAVGVKRAAAIGGKLPGEKLLALLKSDCWESLYELGHDDANFHKLPRGRRPANYPTSPRLQKLTKTAAGILAGSVASSYHMGKAGTGRGTMSYDFEVGQERFMAEAGQTRSRSNKPPSKDLEAIVTLLEVAALSLTTVPGETFTVQELIEAAREIGGGDIEIDERDVMIVLEKQSFLARAGSHELRLK